MMTLGMPASISRKMPTQLARRLGSRSTIASAAPIAIGTPTIRAMAEVMSVPAISGSMPKFAPERCFTPSVFAITALYPPPRLNALLVKKPRPS
jgi:hypothetical protein